MFILQALYFFLPAYFANMAPVFGAKFFGSRYEGPIDFGVSFRGKRIFGDHKTWRGLFLGIVVAILTVIAQAALLRYELFADLSILDYQQFDLIWLGFLFGFGALAGDAVKSFFKRRIGKKPGAAWPVFDQLDFVVGGLIAISFAYQPPLRHVLTLLILSPVLHLGVNGIGYLLGLKKNPW